MPRYRKRAAWLEKGQMVSFHSHGAIATTCTLPWVLHEWVCSTARPRIRWVTLTPAWDLPWQSRPACQRVLQWQPTCHHKMPPSTFGTRLQVVVVVGERRANKKAHNMYHSQSHVSYSRAWSILFPYCPRLTIRDTSYHCVVTSYNGWYLDGVSIDCNSPVSMRKSMKFLKCLMVPRQVLLTYFSLFLSHCNIIGEPQ